jgi:hypothetical protein
MKKIGLAALLALAFVTTADARSHHSGSAFYTNVSGHSVHRPMYAAQRPAGASAQCGDGSYSFSEHHQGTCSHHGGVSRWF